VLAAALGGLGAVVVSRFATPESVKAANNDAITVGNPFTGTTATSITVTGAANAIVGSSDTGTGLRGSSTSTSGVVDPLAAERATGVLGTAGDTTDWEAANTNTSETGVYGFADTSVGSNGVWGDSFRGSGVYGSGDTGVYGVGYWGVYALGRIAVMGDGLASDTGVYGFSGDGITPVPPPGVGVQATAGSTAQTALNVSGKAKFSRSGRTSVASGRSSRKITMAGVTKGSYIIATLQTRRTGVYVQAVVPATLGGSFTIYLNKTVSGTTYVGYLVIN
jgi:hypothetical protein